LFQNEHHGVSKALKVPPCFTKKKKEKSEKDEVEELVP